MDSQLIINSAFGIISVLAGWVFRMVWGRIQELEDDLEDLEKHHEADLKEARKEISELALAMPEKYVAKQDLDKLIDFINPIIITFFQHNIIRFQHNIIYVYLFIYYNLIIHHHFIITFFHVTKRSVIYANII